MLEQITQFLIQLMNQIGLVGVFIATTIESFFPPIPSEIVLLTAGFYAKEQDSFTLLIVLSLVAALGNYVGTLPFYLISKKGAETFLPKFLNKWGKFLLITNKDIDRAEKFFEKYGNITIFLSKLIPGIRSLIAFPAGVSQVKLLPYTIYSIAGSFVWDLILGMVGFFAYENREQVFKVIEPFEKVIIFLIALGAVIYIASVARQFIKLRNETQK